MRTSRVCTPSVSSQVHLVDPLSAADRTRNAKTAARIERYRLASKENNLFVTAASGITAHKQATAGVKVEYSRQLKGNFYWGADFSARLHLGSLMDYDWSGRGPVSYTHLVSAWICILQAQFFSGL